MLYIHYEEIPLPQMNKTLIKLVFSTERDSAIISGSSAFNLIKTMTALIKQIPSSNRDQHKYPSGAWAWIFPKSKFEELKTTYIAAKWTSASMIIMHPQAHIDLFVQHGISYGIKPKNENFRNIKDWKDATEAAPNAEDFFYNKSQPLSTGEMPIEQLKTKLIALLGTDVIDKSSYKKACRRYHPDFNGGDGSKMSELNYLYKQYTQLTNI